MEFKKIFYYFCCCFYTEPTEQQNNYITYNDIYKRNDYDTSILDYTTSS